jgi:hypothetical protein
MKQFWFLLSYLFISLVYSQDVIKKFDVQISEVNNEIVEISNESVQKLEDLGFQLSPQYTYLGRNFSEHFDFNNDGFKDIVWVVPKDPSIGSPVMILFWDQERKRYVEQTSYFVLGHGDHMMYYDTVDDFDGDGDLDIYLPIENYHGEEGKQPDYYFPGGNHVPGNVFINESETLRRVYIDTTSFENGPSSRDYPRYGQASLIYYDEDDKKDLIVPSVNVRPDAEGFLAMRFSFDSDFNISREPVFPWESSERYQGQSHSIMLKNYNNLIYAFLQPREVFYPEEQGSDFVYNYTFPEVWIYEKSKNGNPPLIKDKIELLRNTELINQREVSNYNTFYIHDLDNDGSEEFIIGMFSWTINDQNYSDPIFDTSVHIFDQDGKEITDQWFYDDEFIETTKSKGISFDFIDLNNDGLMDLLMRDRFNSTDTQIPLFLNTGSKFERHVIETNGPPGFNITVDTDKDGLMEILKIRNQEPDPNKVVTQYVLSYKNISDEDGDGIFDDVDQCPNTLEGVIVDSNGCEFFSLPDDVFSVNVVSSTCIGSDNGSINLSTSDSSFNYLYSVNGSDPLPFQNIVTISGLETGSYQVCFTVEGVSNYNRCYTVKVGEPAPLEASSMVDMDNRTINLNLSGAKSYNILLNGKSISTDKSIISLPLQSGKNTIEVKGDQECQGLYFEEIFVSEEVKVYPNPTNGPLQLYVSGLDNQVTVDVTSINGTKVMSSMQSVPMNRVIELNLSDLNPGMYIVSVKGTTVQVHQKVIRK